MTTSAITVRSSVGGSEAEAWLLTAAVSPRPSVRVAAVDVHGEALNAYTGHRRISGEIPDRPWAVYLAGHEGRFSLIAFDFDAKTAGAGTAAARDAAAIAKHLDAAGIAHVICESGPSGGRHVWAALAETVDADTIGTLARLARHLCPTLDIAPLTNPTTGCVRPPGSPHRDGGASKVLSGDVAALTSPHTTAEQVRTLVEHLAQLVDVDEPTHTAEPHMPLPLDEHGHLYLPGPRRELPASSAAAVRDDAASGDASAVLWRVLIGAAAAKWRHSDVAALVDHAPGLEHVRTVHDRSGRRTRPISGPNSAAAVLRRQWKKAVKYVATSDRQIGDDPTFDARAAAIAAHVRDVQARADAAAGRWVRGGGPADRRVLDVLCILSLQALSGTVEADTRRVALLAGIGRETARTGLLRLAGDGWIVQSGTPEGPHGAAWTIDPKHVLHRDTEISRSQADPRPEGAGAAERSILLTELRSRTTAAAHDLFTLSPGLGLLAGNLHARLTPTPQSLTELGHEIGADLPRTMRALDRLTSAGVLVQRRDGWALPRSDRRGSVAKRLGVEGRLRHRAQTYAIEREMWAWWQAEQEWMRAPRRTASHRRPARGQLTLLPELGTNAYGAHPRRADGSADYRAARHEIETEHGIRTAESAPEHAEAPVHEPATDLERMLADKLGARLIGVESYEPSPMKAIA